MSASLCLFASACSKSGDLPVVNESAAPLVRFKHDPIRVDGHGEITRRDYERAFAMERAAAWLKVLALEAAVRDDARALDCKDPEVKRVLELVKLVDATPALRTCFPSFPASEPASASEAPSSKTCSFRLGLLLANLEVLAGDVRPAGADAKPGDEALHEHRLDEALMRYAPRLTATGAQCDAAVIDAREVYPELLARSGLAWRENFVRRLLGAAAARPQE